MDAVLRALVIYAVLLALFRIAGKRTLMQMTPFDFVLLLVVAEATQQGLLGDDFSVTNAILVVSTLVGVDIFMAMLKRRHSGFAKAAEGRPVVLLENGRPIEQRMKRARIAEEDILESARQNQGIERLEQIKYAVLEQSGGISIIPRARS